MKLIAIGGRWTTSVNCLRTGLFSVGLGFEERRRAEFIARENIKRFRQQVENCTDDRQRNTLKVLLASEQAHLERLEDEHAKLGTTRPHPVK